MQRCAICEKALYGHPDAKSKPIVCGSCPLQKVSGGKSGKGEFEVHLAMNRLVKSPSTVVQERSMNQLIIKSNFARNRTILLDGRYPLHFDADGKAKMPAHQLPLLEREMTAKPGRFWVEEPAVEAPAPVVAKEEPAPAAVKMPVEKVEDIHSSVDLSYLQEEKKAPVKAAKKK